MTRLYGALAALALCSSCYSEIIHNTSPNAAADAQQWVMTNIIPEYTGLKINSVTYQYTAMKDAQDQMVVEIRNQNVGAAGYIFRSVDDWSGLPGNTITKSVGVPEINKLYSLWGNGEIAIRGIGKVVDANVIYNYSYDPCNADPLYSPSCPGYDAAWAKKMLELVPETILPEQQDVAYDNSTELPDSYKDEDSESVNSEKQDAEEKERRKRIGVKAAENAMTQSIQITQTQLIDLMNYLPQFQTYYVATISGGVYNDSEMYKPKNLPENKKGLRVGLAQQLVHEKMVDLQYKNNK